MLYKCKGITRSGRRCKRKIRGNHNCHQHTLCSFQQTKPEDCAVCYDSLLKQQQSLDCGHWIHTECIIKSGKAECPICRAEVTLNKTNLKELEKIAKAHRLEEEEQNGLQLLEEHIQDFVNDILNDYAIYSFINIHDVQIYQELLENLVEDEYVENLIE